jgi:hypothetical protein
VEWSWRDGVGAKLAMPLFSFLYDARFSFFYLETAQIVFYKNISNFLFTPVQLNGQKYL